MKKPTTIAIALLLQIAVATPLLAQEEEPIEAGERTEQASSAESRIGGEVRFHYLRFENFFQAPADEPETDVNAAQLRAELAYRLGDETPLEAYLEGGHVFYEDLDDSNRIGAGLRLDGDPHAFDLRVAQETTRPILDVGDELETADVIHVDGEYGYRITDDWELKGLLQVQDQSFETTASKDNTIHGVGGAVRYRGFGYGFSPEVGFLAGARDATDPNENHSQTDLYLQVRSVPAEGWYVSARYRRRARDYDTEVVDDRNFGREDDRNQLSAVVAYELTESLGMDAYYAYQDAESTLPGRTFTTQILFLGLDVDF